MPVVVYSLNAASQSLHWKQVAAKHNIERYEVRPAVDAADSAAMRLWAPELVAIIDGLSAENRRMSDIKTPLKRVAQWATAMQFFEYVLRRNTTTLHLDDDAILHPTFCAAGNRAIKRVMKGKFGFRQEAFVSPAVWERRGFDALYFGHCYEFYGHRADSVGLNLKGKCHKITNHEFISVAYTPFCEHAYALSPRGAAKLLSALSSWNATYTALHRQRVTKHGWMRHDRPGRGGAQGVDFAIVKQIRRYNRFDAYDMWPQVALQAWQKDVKDNVTNTTELLRHMQVKQGHANEKYSRVLATKCKEAQTEECSPRAQMVRAADLQTPMGCYCYQGHLGRWKTRRAFRRLVNCSLSPESVEQPDTYIADAGLQGKRS